MASPRHSTKSAHRLRLYSVTAFLLILLVVGIPAGAGFLTTYALLYPPCDETSATPGDFGYTWEDVTLEAENGRHMRAYFIPGSNQAAVIILPTTAHGRGSRLDLAAMLAQHGYNVLTYESRRCAKMGPLSLGYKEAADISGALAYLHTRPEVAPDRIGIMGFSSAGAAAVMAAARYPEVRAVVAEGGYGDFAEGAVGIGENGGTFLEYIYKRSIEISYHQLTGVDIDRLSPIDDIRQIAPRPILLIYGSLEGSLVGGKKQAAAAGENAELWIVEGAGHGTYRHTAPEEYEKRILTFFNKALLKEEGNDPGK